MHFHYRPLTGSSSRTGDSTGSRTDDGGGRSYGEGSRYDGEGDGSCDGEGSHAKSTPLLVSMVLFQSSMCSLRSRATLSRRLPPMTATSSTPAYSPHHSPTRMFCRSHVREKEPEEREYGGKNTPPSFLGFGGSDTVPLEPVSSVAGWYTVSLEDSLSRLG
jgi:hypothetical protein